MSKKRELERKKFTETASALHMEVISGKWDHKLDNWSGTSIEEWHAVLDEFSSRCPNHEHDDYIQALRRCQWNNR